MCSTVSAHGSPLTRKASTGVILSPSTALWARGVALSEVDATVQRLRGGGAVELTGIALVNGQAAGVAAFPCLFFLRVAIQSEIKDFLHITRRADARLVVIKKPKKGSLFLALP